MPALFYSEIAHIVDVRGELVIDTYELVVEQGWKNGVIIVLPNISFIDVQKSPLRKALSAIGGDTVDITVKFPPNLNVWELGFDNASNGVVVFILLSEYCRSFKTKSELLEELAKLVK